MYLDDGRRIVLRHLDDNRRCLLDNGDDRTVVDYLDDVGHGDSVRAVSATTLISPARKPWTWMSSGSSSLYSSIS